MNTVIVGGPKTGKTTLADSLGKTVRRTDALIGHLEWSELSEQVSHWFDEPGEWVIEGVATVRAIRKWLARDTGPFPAEIILLTEPAVPRTPRQEAMAKGVETVWNQIKGELVERGTSIRHLKPEEQ